MDIRGVLAMTCDESEDPPRFARAGADRCTRRNVVMNGVGRCESFVNAGNNLDPVDGLGEGGGRYNGRAGGIGMMKAVDEKLWKLSAPAAHLWRTAQRGPRPRGRTNIQTATV